MLKKPGRTGTLEKEGKRHVIRTGYLDVWGTEYEEVAKAALASSNSDELDASITL